MHVNIAIAGAAALVMLCCSMIVLSGFLFAPEDGQTEFLLIAE